jgi:hypothetical protein
MGVFERGLFTMGLLFVFSAGVAQTTGTVRSSGGAQTIVKGRVIDKATGEPLENAVITAGEKGRSVLTDEQGNFELAFGGAGDSIHASYVGYREQSLDFRRAGNPCLIGLSRGVVDLRSITVQSLPNNACFSTISKIDVNLHALNSAQDLMRLVPGLSLMQHQGGGIGDHLFFRGFDADHGTDVGVSVDDMPLNMVSHAHGQGYSDLHFLIPEITTSLEYGKGPYFSDHGDFTTAGYLAFRTADVLERSEMKIEAGSFHTGRILTAVNLLSAGAKRRGESAYIAGEGLYTDGPFDFAQHFNRGNLFGKYLVNLSPKTRLKVTLSTFSSLWRSSGEIPERAVNDGLISRWGYIDSAQGGNTTRSTGIVRLATALSDRLSLENQAYYVHYSFGLDYDQTFFADDSVNGDHLQQKELRNEYGYNGKLTLHSYLANGGVLTATAGIGFQWNDIRGSALSHTNAAHRVLEYIQHGDIREWALNGFIDEQYRSGRWLFDAGARLDDLSFYYHDLLNPVQPGMGRAIISPKFSMEFTFNDKTQVYLKLGKGFHSNDAKVTAQDRGIGVLPAAYGADLGFNWKPVSRLYVNAAVWYLGLDQELTYNGDDGTFSPGDKTRREGFDLSVRYQLTRWLFADADVIVSRARNAATAKAMDYLPLSVPFYGTAGLYIKLPGGFNAGWNARYMGNRPANEDNSLAAKGYFLNDLTANYTTHRWEIGLEIQNLFDAKWKDAQYEVESRLKTEPQPVDDISFTPGMPFFAKAKLTVFF